MGIVYRAADRKLGRDVALKFLSGEFRADSERLARFQREARVLASLNHPNIAALYGFEESGPALVMELVDGPTLADRIANGPLPLSEALPIALQIASALEYAHEHGVIHRDLKPANIKITPDGHVKLLDFGLAKALTPDSRSSTLSSSPTLSVEATQAGVLLGTAAYMSPEQAKGKAVDRRTDIWAFGVVVFEMLTGNRVYAGETATETMAHVMLKEPAWETLPTSTPPRLRSLLRRCLTQEPLKRLQSIGDARIEIEEIPNDAAEPESESRPIAVRASRRREFMWAALAMVLLVSTGVLIWREWRQPLSTAMSSVQFDVLPPDGLKIRVVGPGQPLSPDGHKIAFIASSNGPAVLWIRTLDSTSPRAIRGTEGILSFYWSPDSRSIAFATATNVKKVRIEGGDPQVILNRQARDVAWSPEGVILVSGTGPLTRVSENGGEPTEETKLDKSSKENQHDYPHFLPDGRHYLFLVRAGEDSRQRSVYVGTLGSDERHPLPGLDTDTQYSATGHVVFLRNGMLMAQAFDDRQFQLSGEAFPITKPIAPTGAVTTNFSLSRDGSMAYASVENSSETQFVWFDRKGNRQRTEPVSGSLQAPNLSNDGKRVVFERNDTSGKPDIWSLDLARGTDMRLTFNGDGQRPIFSPDGTQFVFRRLIGTTNVIFRKSSGGTGPEERLADGEPTDWSPDGQHILFIRDGDLWDLSLTDRKETRIATGRGNDRRGRFSPDGKWVAYESDESGQFEVYVQNFPPTGNRWPVSANGGGSAWWRSNGSELFFYSFSDQKIMTVDLKPGSTFQASAPRELFTVPGVIANGRFIASRDGQSFLLPVQQEPKPILSVILNWPTLLKNDDK
jgi:serine/threonine protein kinase